MSLLSAIANIFSKLFNSSLVKGVVSKQVAKGVSVLGVVWLVFAEFKNINKDDAMVIAYALAKVTFADCILVATIILTCWLFYLIIINIFIKDINNTPTLFALLLKKLFKL